MFKIRKVNLECVMSFFKKKLVIFSLIYILFYSFWEDVIENIVVDKFFSHFEINIINDIIFFLLLIGVFVIKSIQAKSIKNEKILASIIILAFWCYYRFCSERFVFFSLATIEEVKYIDIVAVYSFCEFLNCIKNIHKSSFAFGDGFDRDSPIEKDNEDLLGREDLAKDAVEKILNTDTSNDAFSFGITSPWGTGKTSFMNLMKNYIKIGHRECIAIDFNPWLYSHKGDIITLFFDELSKNLREYDRGLASEITNYSNVLSSIETAETKIASTIIDIIMPSSKLEDKITAINKSIKQIGKKIVVFVDDIDRLDSTEIMEVLKLIRNISNFPYMYFVVAYDKDYILECLKGKMPSNELKYTEKIFQVEFPLPLFGKERIKDSIYNSISKFVENDDDKKELRNFLYEKNIWGKGNALIEDNISTIRDVKRIVNSFHVSYSWLKGEINVCNLFVLEILKTKYPIVYSIFERDKQYVLKRNEFNCYVLFGDIANNYLFSQIDDKDKYNFRKYLTENHTDLHINGSDENKINNILSYLFPSGASNVLKKNINNYSYTNRYFSITIPVSDIPDSEFDEIIEKDMDNIKFAFAEWSETKSYALYAKIKQFQPKDKEEQKKYIRILLYSTSIIQCDNDFITNQIIELKEFNNNKHFSDEDKQFIKCSLCENGYSEGLTQYLYNVGFENNTYDYPITKDELNDVRRNVFYDCIDKNQEDIRKVMDGYLNTEETYLVNGNRATASIPEKKSSMKSYVINHLVDFITYTIVWNGSDQYFVNKWWPTHLWDNWEEFVSYLNDKKDKTPAILEYIDFINKSNGTNREARPVSFTFKHLKLQNETQE